MSFLRANWLDLLVFGFLLALVTYALLHPGATVDFTRESFR